MSDGAWHPTLAIGDLVDGTARRIEVAGRVICLAKVAGQVFALDDICSHEDAPLSEGLLWADTCEIECPLHASTFNLRTGWPSNPPATEPVTVYSVRAISEHIEVNVPTT